MENTLLPLSIIKISGQDAQTFLQGQLTQDMATLNREWNFAAQCNPQGRVIAFFIVFKWEDNFYVLIDDENLQQTIDQLKKYVMRSDVHFEPLELNSYFIASGQTKQEDTQNHNSRLVESDNESFKLHYNEGYLIVTNKQPENVEDINEWKLANIENSVPSLKGKALGQFTPEAISLDILGAVSFTKGCYTGQEIVARMHYLGKAKKRLFKAKLKGNLETIEAGDKISDSEGKTIGNLVDFEKSGNCLISIKTSLNTELAKNKSYIQAVNGELML